MSPIELVRSRLDGVHGQDGNLRARCPAHGSRGGTLAVREGRGGVVLLKCHAGCEAAAIIAAVGLEMRDLWPREERSAMRRVASRPPRVELADELDCAAQAFRDERHLDSSQRLVHADLVAIRRTVSVRCGVTLPTIERRVADSWAGGYERESLFPMLLDRAWEELWLERDGALPCCGVDAFAAHGATGLAMLTAAELRAIAELRRIAADERRARGRQVA